MKWFDLQDSLAYKLYTIYAETIELYRKPSITILFNDERRNKYLELIKRFYLLLGDVHRLECECPLEGLEHQKNERL